MKSVALNVVAPVLFSAALLSLASCSSDSDMPKPTSESSSSTQVQEGVPGGTVVETMTMTANVTHVDPSSREVRLATPDGKTQTVKCGPQVVNFDQIRVGDQVRVTVTEELAVYMATEGAAPISGEAGLVALAPKGTRPGGVMAAAVQEVATVTAIDLARHKATLRFSDGSTRMIAVRPDVDLTQRKVGEKVVMRVTQGVAISVEKP